VTNIDLFGIRPSRFGRSQYGEAIHPAGAMAVEKLKKPKTAGKDKDFFAHGPSAVCSP
jgi:hypothetical protein